MLTQFATINATPTERSDEGSQNVAKKRYLPCCRYYREAKKTLPYNI